MKGKIPFLETSLKEDVLLLLLFIPLWYILGLDQFVWPLVAFFMILKMLLLKIKNENARCFYNNFFLKTFLIFLIVHLISGVFLSQTDQKPYLYIRDFCLYLSSFIFSMVVITHFSLKDIRMFFLILVGIGLLSISIVLLSIVGILNYDFYGLCSTLFPEFLWHNEFFLNMIHKTPFEVELHEKTYFYEFFETKRPRAIFMSATQFACFLATLVPISIYLSTISAGVKKLFFGFISVLFFASILFTLSRTGILGLLLGIFALFVLRKNYLRKCLIALIGILVILSVGYKFNIHEIFLQRFGGGSDITRMRLYKMTLMEILNNPIFGHGTLVTPDSSVHLPPLGSHSTFLRIAFTKGLIGITLFLSMISYVAYSLWRLSHIKKARLFYEMAVVLFIILVFQALFVEWLYDAVYFIFVWLILSTIIRAMIIAKRESFVEQ